MRKLELSRQFNAKQGRHTKICSVAHTTHNTRTITQGFSFLEGNTNNTTTIFASAEVHSFIEVRSFFSRYSKQTGAPLTLKKERRRNNCVKLDFEEATRLLWVSSNAEGLQEDVQLSFII